MIPLFVYGTLMRGEENAHLLERARFLCACSTEAGFVLVNLGSWPGMLPGGDGAVTGELHEVSAATLAVLDAFEEHPSLFERGPVQLADGRRAETYFIREVHARGAPRIPHGDWRRR